MPLGPGDLVLCAGTLARASLRERIEAAVAGGFRGLSLFPSDVRRARDEGASDERLRGWLAERDLEIAELDPLATWLPGVEPGVGPFATTEPECYALARSLGARSLNAVVFAREALPFQTLVESFAALCDRAEEEGLVVHLEFMPWTQVGSALDAWAVVEAADRPNGGLMFDTWHHARSGVDDATLFDKVPAERVLAVQLNDAPARAETDLIAETLNRRRLPGDGDIDLPAILRWLRDGRSPAPLGIEVFSEALFDLPPTEVARRCADATRAVLAAVS